MPARSLLGIRSLLVLGAAAVLGACGTSAPEGVDDGTSIASHVSPANCPTCGNPAPPPLTVMPASLAFGEVGVFDDPMGGIRRGVVNLVVPTTGTLSALFTSFTDEWKVTGFQWSSGRSVVGAGPVTVTAGDQITLSVEFVANIADPSGPQNSVLLLNNQGSIAEVPVTITEDLLSQAAAVLDVHVSLICETYGADGAIQLGQSLSACTEFDSEPLPSRENVFEFELFVQNLGGAAGVFRAPITGVGYTIGCGTYTGSTQTIEPGQVFTMSCEGSSAPTARPGTGYTYPITVGTSGGNRSFSYGVDVVGTLPSGSSSGGSSGSGSSGGAPPSCVQKGTTCEGTGGDTSSCLSCKEFCPGSGTCTALGTFCTSNEAIDALSTATCSENAIACCGDQCDVYAGCTP